ncbi:MAG: adenylate/guanylate cyclase domain-containing protein [Lacunisphaera sp.]
MSSPFKPVSQKIAANEELSQSVETTSSREISISRMAGQMTELTYGNAAFLKGETKEELQRVFTTALELLAQLGFTVTNPDQERTQQSAAITSGVEELKLHRKDVRALLQLWKNRPKHLWPKAVIFYTLAAEYFCQHGEAFAGVDVCQEGLRFYPGDSRLIQLKAWALAQSGATDRAQELLADLDRRSDGGTETWGLLARTCKDMAAVEPDPLKKRELLSTALRHYEKGYEFSLNTGQPDYYPAINCAALCVRLTDEKKAREWAERARQLAANETPCGLWAEATLAEAALILGRTTDAMDHYRAFARECGSQRAVIASARRQVVQIFGSDQPARQFLAECLPLPPVYTLAAEAKASVERPAVAVLCPWTTNDVATVNELFAQGTEVHLVFPFPLENYGPNNLRMSLEQVNAWQEQAASITLAHPRGAELTAEIASFCAFLQTGRARRLADTWSTDLSFPRPTDLSATGEGLHAYQATMLALHEGRATAAGVFSPRSMAFADVVGYGQLDEPQVAYFQQAILPQIAEFFRKTDCPPVFVQTWGDAFYLGFGSVREGGLAALALRRFFSKVPWCELGFKNPLKLRFALHSGPVIAATDPFNGNRYFTGTVVSRGARIEPLTDEDQIFCSDAFSAVASALKLRDFTLTFAGTYLLPKNAGEEPLFRLAPVVGGS